MHIAHPITFPVRACIFLRSIFNISSHLQHFFSVIFANLPFLRALQVVTYGQTFLSMTIAFRCTSYVLCKLLTKIMHNFRFPHSASMLTNRKSGTFGRRTFTAQKCFSLRA